MALFKPPFRHDQNLSAEKAGKASIEYSSGNFDFLLEVEGKLAGAFQYMMGGDISITVIKHDVVFETGDSTTYFIPGQTNFGHIELQRGVIKDQLGIYKWFAEASAGDIIQARRNGTIWMYGPQAKVGDPPRVLVAQWNFYNAWPIKIEGFSWSEHTNVNFASVQINFQPEYIERVV